MAVGWFHLSVLALSSLGLMSILFTVYWMQNWHGGFAWDGSILMFNCHPVLMVAGMVVVYSAGEYEVSMADMLWPRPGRSRAIPLSLWVQGCGGWVGWSVFGPRCHLEEEIVRMGTCEKGSFTDTALRQGCQTFSIKGQVIYT